MSKPLFSINTDMLLSFPKVRKTYLIFMFISRRISGLNEGRAKKIIEYRQEHNGFESRAEILKVTGIGKITFQQCAGFLTVLGSSEPLDTTIIHPESYKIAKS